MIEGQGVHLSLNEGTRRASPIREGALRFGFSGKSRPDRQVFLQIGGSVGGRGELTWSDRAQEPLEQQLGVII